MTEKAAAPKLRVVCAKCGETLAPLARACPRCPDALPRAAYAEKRFVVEERGDIFRFHAWLPARTKIDTTVGPALFRSERLAAALEMADLTIAFSGYAPQVGARNPTGTFKDFEALRTLLHLREHGAEGLVLASAGNTARAFAYAAGLLDFPTTIVVSESAAPSLWIPAKPTGAVRVVALAKSCDYTAAIRLADAIAERWGLQGRAERAMSRDAMEWAP